MSDYEKTSKEYLDAWRTNMADMQDLRFLLDAERERVRVLRESAIALLMNRSGIDEWYAMEQALATTAPEAGERAAAAMGGEQ